MLKPVELLVGEMVKVFEQIALLGKLKIAVGFSNTINDCVLLSLQPLLFVAINFTSYTPLFMYVFVGDVNMDVVPSPKSHK